jgi:multiple sugar transport system substrate-binding protein
MSKKKAAGTAAAAGAAASVLGACAPAATPTPTPKPAVPTAVPTIKREPVKLLFWMSENVPNRIEAFQTIIDEFNAGNPDVEVTMEPYANTERATKVGGAIQAGQPPDVCHSPPNFLWTLPDDVYYPVDDIVAAIDEEYHFTPLALKGLTWNGHIWNVPMYVMTHIIMYCTDRLEEAGFDKPPATWDEWLTQCKAMTHDDKYAIAFPTNKHPLTQQCISDVILPNRGMVFDEQQNLVFNSPEVVEAYEMCAELIKYTTPDAPVMTWAESNLALITGQVAMAQLFGAPWGRFPGEAPDRAAFLKAALQPLPPGGVNRCVGGANTYVLFTDDPDKHEAAKQFLLYLHKPGVYGRWLATMQPLLFLPLTEAGLEDQSFYEHETVQFYGSEVPRIMESVNYATDFGNLYDEPARDWGPISGDLTLPQVLQKIAFDGMSPADAVKWGEDRMRELIA